MVLSCGKRRKAAIQTASVPTPTWIRSLPISKAILAICEDSGAIAVGSCRWQGAGSLGRTRKRNPRRRAQTMTNADLLATILNNPRNDAHRLAYADLIAASDPARAGSSFAPG